LFDYIFCPLTVPFFAGTNTDADTDIGIDRQYSLRGYAKPEQEQRETVEENI